jgi:predicted CoA-binding protein
MAVEEDERMRQILKEAKSIAVVGVSPNPWRDSGTIAQFLREKGYRVFPVNPKYDEVLGHKCFPSLTSIGQPVDIVDIFRRSEGVPPIVDEAIHIGAHTVWMQLGVVSPEAAARAEEGGLRVIMDRCIAIDYRRLMK